MKNEFIKREKRNGVSTLELVTQSASSVRSEVLVHESAAAIEIETDGEKGERG